MRQQIRRGPLTIAAALQEFERQANQANRTRVRAATIPKTNTGLMTRSGTRGYASPAARVDRAGNDAFPPSSPQVMAAERERRVREGQAKKAALTAELDRMEANRAQLGTSISWSHYLNIKDQLRQLKRDITLNKGLTPADVLATRRDPELGDEDQTHPLVEWSNQAGPAFLKFARALGTALDDSSGVHTDEERRSAVDSLPGSFRRGVTQPVLSLPTSAMHQGSTSISRGLGNGPIHPEIYEKDLASRVSNNVGAVAPYLIPGVGTALAAMQKADMAAQFAEDPVQAGRDLYENTAPWTAKTPEERLLRSITLVLSGAHATKQVRVRARQAYDAVRNGRRIDPSVAQEVVAAGIAEYNSRNMASPGENEGAGTNRESVSSHPYVNLRLAEEHQQSFEAEVRRKAGDGVYDTSHAERIIRDRRAKAAQWARANGRSPSEYYIPRDKPTFPTETPPYHSNPKKPGHFRISDKAMAEPVNPYEIDEPLFTENGPKNIWPSVRAYILDNTRKRNYIRKIHNEDTGWDIDVSVKGIYKSSSGKRFPWATAEAMVHAPELIRQARRVSTRFDRNMNPDLPLTHEFVAPVSIRGKYFAARIRVNEQSTGTKHFYSIRSVSVEPANWRKASTHEGATNTDRAAGSPMILRDFVEATGNRGADWDFRPKT